MSNQENEGKVVHMSDEMLDSIAEAVEDMQDHHLQSADSYSELMEILNE